MDELRNGKPVFAIDNVLHGKSIITRQHFNIQSRCIQQKREKPDISHIKLWLYFCLFSYSNHSDSYLNGQILPV